MHYTLIFLAVMLVIVIIGLLLFGLGAYEKDKKRCGWDLDDDL